MVFDIYIYIFFFFFSNFQRFKREEVWSILPRKQVPRNGPLATTIGLSQQVTGAVLSSEAHPRQRVPLTIVRGQEEEIVDNTEPSWITIYAIGREE